jgi:hypothetical protein
LELGLGEIDAHVPVLRWLGSADYNTTASITAAMNAITAAATTFC